jgi:hypothetical protein
MMVTASRHHNLSRNDFLKLTPREFYAIEQDYLEEFSIKKEVSDRQTARIMLAIYKASPKFKRINKTEEDFMPLKKVKNRSVKDLVAKARTIQLRMGAIKKHNEKVKNGS